MNQGNLKSDLIALFNETAGYAKKFHKKTYETNMDHLGSRYAALFSSVKETIEASDEALDETASIIPDYVAGLLEAIPSKRKRDNICLDYNMNMVSFFTPLMGEIKSIKTGEFTGRMVEMWNLNMPHNKIGLSTRGQIQAGFRQGLCYITTAVIKSLNKPDDCYELTLLRDYRDGYLMESKEGMETVKEYYNIAPTIVKRIDNLQDPAAVYTGIWQDYLRPCVSMIEKDQLEECRTLYSDMVRKLEKKYLYS